MLRYLIILLGHAFLCLPESSAAGLPAPGLVQSRPNVPLLTDGESRVILDLKLTLDQPRILRSVRIHAGAGPGDLSSLSLDLPGEWKPGAPHDGEITFKGEAQFPPGVHRFSLKGTAAPGLDLLARLHPRCVELTFADGTSMRPQEAALPPLRPAYPIHKRGQFQCHTFRIPAIARAMDGSLLAVYDMRYLSEKDLQGHMDIGLSRSSDGGQTWTAPVPIMDMGEFGGKPQDENGCSDANILVDPKSGEALVSAVWTHGKPGTHQWVGKGSEPGHDLHRSSQFLIVRSRDHGKTWSEPENWTSRLKDPAWHLFAPAPGNGIAMRDGTLVIPAQGRDASGLPFSNLMFSKDHGKTWTVSAPARSDTTECAVAELADGSLLLNMRDNRNRGNVSNTNGRAMAVTGDLGSTWAVHPADHGALPEPVCMASMISHTLPDGRHILLFSNPRNKSARKDMTIQISFDQGHTWPRENHILLDEAGGAYSSLVMMDDETIGILYESSQADLVFQKISLSEMIK
jgi:sialidase-1